MSDNNSGDVGGLSFAITLVFVVLKLGGVIEWNWIWVLSPLWVGTVLLVVFFGGFTILGSLVYGFFKITDKFFSGKKVKGSDD